MADVLNKIMGGLIAIAGAAGLVGAGGAFSSHFNKEARKAEAREAGPPPRVAIEAFRPSRHVGGDGEVILRGRLRLSETRLAPSRDTSWITPLYAENRNPAAEDAEKPQAWLVGDPRAADHRPGEGLRGVALLESRGAEGGPLAEIRGRRVDPNLHYEAVKHSRGDFNRGEVVVEPFIMDREAAFAPKNGPLAALGLFMALSAAMLLYGLWLGGRP